MCLWVGKTARQLKNAKNAVLNSAKKWKGTEATIAFAVFAEKQAPLSRETLTETIVAHAKKRGEYNDD